MHTEIHSYHPPMASVLDILHIDEALLVVNKPAGLLSVPGRGADKQDSLATRVQTTYPDALIVHRLDMDTSGLMIMAREITTQRMLGNMFAERQVEKHYIAIVSGLVAQDEGEIKLPLVCDWPNRPRQMVDHLNGKPAHTLYKVTSRDTQSRTTHVQLTPVTGRTHQLRVHMQALGHPIIGDPLYGNDKNKHAVRMMLHASSLGFQHPTTRQPLHFKSRAPF